MPREPERAGPSIQGRRTVPTNQHPNEKPLLAVGLASGQLVLLDPITGEARFRARFDGPVRALAAVDLEGDGTDELVAAANRKLALLRGKAPEPIDQGDM